MMIVAMSNNTSMFGCHSFYACIVLKMLQGLCILRKQGSAYSADSGRSTELRPLIGPSGAGTDIMTAGFRPFNSLNLEPCTRPPGILPIMPSWPLTTALDGNR